MKTTSLVLVFCCLLLSVAGRASDVAAVWSAELVAAQQATAQDSGGRTRADEIFRAVLIGAMNGLGTNKTTGRTAEPVPVRANREAAAAVAAHAALTLLYPEMIPSLDARLAESLTEIRDSEAAIAAGTTWGEHVADVILDERREAVLPNASSFDAKVAFSVEPQPVPDAEVVTYAVAPGRYRFNTLAGTPYEKGHVDGVGSAARFDNPQGIAVDAAGNVYVSDSKKHIIRKITLGGAVTTLAGMAGEKGDQDGVGSAARFAVPCGLAVDRLGNVYVADIGNHTIRKIDSAGVVTTIAGTAGLPGDTDGPRETARLIWPTYVAVDDAGNVFVSEDSGIRKVAPDGTVSTLKVTIPANFFYGYPLQLVADSKNNLYVVYTDGWDLSRVLKCTPTAPSEYASEILSDPFFSPADSGSGWATCLGIDAVGNLYVKYVGNPVCVFMPDGKIEVRYTDYPNYGPWRDLAVNASGGLFVLSEGSYGFPEPVVRVGFYDAGEVGPLILGQLASLTVRAGDYMSISVSAVGAGTLAYQWYFNGNPINGATQSSLTLTSAQPSDAGDYHVVVTDRDGMVTSNVAKVTVKAVLVPPPPPPDDQSKKTPPSPAGGGGAVSPGFLVALTVLFLLRKHRVR